MQSDRTSSLSYRVDDLEPQSPDLTPQPPDFTPPDLLQPHQTLLGLVEDDQRPPADLPDEVGHGLTEDGRVGVDADAVRRSLEIVVPPRLHEGNLESLSHGLYVVARRELSERVVPSLSYVLITWRRRRLDRRLRPLPA